MNLNNGMDTVVLEINHKGQITVSALMKLIIEDPWGLVSDVELRSLLCL